MSEYYQTVLTKDALMEFLKSTKTRIIAEASGVNHATIRNYSSGRTSIEQMSATKLVKLSKAAIQLGFKTESQE